MKSQQHADVPFSHFQHDHDAVCVCSQAIPAYRYDYSPFTKANKVDPGIIVRKARVDGDKVAMPPA